MKKLLPHLASGLLVAILSMGSAPGSSATQAGTNLLFNPSFESGLTGWTLISGSPTVVTYGTPSLPSPDVASQIGGGALLLRDSGNSVVQQVVSLPAPSGLNLRVGGFFGGGGADDSRLTVEFLDGSGLGLGFHTLPYVTRENRNFEIVLMVRESVLSIPSAAVEARVRVELRNNGSDGVVAGAADALYVELTPDSVTPPPVPHHVELLSNGSFEHGWSPASPLTLIDPQGWEGVGPAACVVKPYSNSDTTVPTPTVAAIIGGAGQLLSDQGGGASIKQRLDLRGNAALPGGLSGLALRVSAHLGGYLGSEDHSRIDVRFLSSSLTVLEVATIGPVTRPQRNGETVLLRRLQELAIHPSTRFVDVTVTFSNAGGDGGVYGLLDEVSARLVPETPLQRIPRDVNVVSNGGFEAGSLPGSPLELTNPDGWFGLNNSRVQTISYGQDSTVPSAAFGNSNGLGGLLLRDHGGNAGLRQVFDLRADAAEIDSARYFVEGRAWLGGHSNQTDRAEMRVRFLNHLGVQIGPLHVLGPVTAADRVNQTVLLYRSLPFQMPPLARSMELDLLFTNDSGGGIHGMCDQIELIVTDILQPPSSFCSGDGSGASCPCANTGLAGHGCANSIFASGCKLVATGSSSVSANDLKLVVTRTVPYQPGVFFQGNNAVNGGGGVVFGDGLRCVGMGLSRLQVLPADPSGGAQTTVAIAAEGGATAGQIKHYQWWYRNPIGSPCGAGHNLSNGVTVHWVP